MGAEHSTDPERMIYSLSKPWTEGSAWRPRSFLTYILLFFPTVGEESRAQLLQTGGTGRVRGQCACGREKDRRLIAICGPVHSSGRPQPLPSDLITSSTLPPPQPSQSQQTWGGKRSRSSESQTNETDRWEVRRAFFVCVCVSVFKCFYYSWYEMKTVCYDEQWVFCASELCHLFYLIAVSFAVFFLTFTHLTTTLLEWVAETSLFSFFSS